MEATSFGLMIRSMAIGCIEEMVLRCLADARRGIMTVPISKAIAAPLMSASAIMTVTMILRTITLTLNPTILTFEPDDSDPESDGSDLGPHNAQNYYLPYCDFINSHSWLVDIGERNRLKIQHVQLRFFSSRLTMELLNRWFDDGKPGFVGGGFFW